MPNTPEQPAYLITATRACAVLHEALALALADLPIAIKTQHWIAAKTSPSPWRSVEAHFRDRHEYGTAVLDTLTDLALLSEALAAMTSVVTPIRTDAERPLDLTLRKVKRVEGAR